MRNESPGDLQQEGVRAHPEEGRAPDAAESPSLAHPFKIIAFDWDGTAVTSRKEDATIVRGRLEQLLRLGVFIVVTTGTSFHIVDQQFSSLIAGPHKRGLYICTNRGSEVYGFDERSRPVLIWKRVATPTEDRLLTEVADAVRRDVERRTGLEIRVVYNRLNRRKIDLIPLPEWADPPKSMIDRLLVAVQRRVRDGGIPGGLQEVFAEVEETARRKGLSEARITSDVKHVEVGLTDKGDSIAWMMRELAAKQGIAPGDILIGGDEFGPIAGFPGSDYKMAIPAARGATFVSVGVEPSGVPPNVIHLGGGPQRFIWLLERQIELHEKAPPPGAAEPTEATVVTTAPSGEAPHAEADRSLSEQAWLMVEKGYQPRREHEIESLFTLANGYLGTRGSLPEGAAMSTPATFIAGVFDSPLKPMARHLEEKVGSVPDRWASELAIAPDWAALRVFAEGEEIDLEEGETVEHERYLDLKRGVLERDWLHTDEIGRTTRLHYRRFVSLANRHILVESTAITPENYSGRLRVISGIDGRPAAEVSTDVAEPARLITRNGPPPMSSTEDGSPLLLVAQTSTTANTVAFACAMSFEGGKEEPAHMTLREEGWIGERWDWEGRIGTTYRIDKIVAVSTSRDAPDPEKAAAALLAEASAMGIDQLLRAHVAAWAERWRASAVSIVGEEDAQRAINFAVYHLIGSANPDDEYVSIGARSLTGSSYKGHVFWDTEIFMLPFYTYTYPRAARSLLMYRYHTLPQAVRKAEALGYRGALYPWESADTGEEVAPKSAFTPQGELVYILTGDQEHHISADVAYAVWQYWLATHDEGFLLGGGAEIILQTARFWASRGSFGDDGKYHIRRVIGPDEYHEAVDDNAYTNVMAQWNLERGGEVAALLRSRQPDVWSDLSSRLAVSDEELRQWQDIASRMYTGFDPKTGLFEQFRGYFDLEYVDLAEYEPRTVPMDVILGRERTYETQVIKQADVVMLMYLLWDRFPAAVREANFRCYEPRCGHGSSLSPSVHALVAARLGDYSLARKYLYQAREIDFANNMGNAAGGVHTAAQGGIWQAVVLGFGGLQVREDGLSIDPHPLPEWHRLAFNAQWHGRQVDFRAGTKPSTLDVEMRQGDRPVPLTVGEKEGRQVMVEKGRRYRAEREDHVWRPWQEQSE